MPIPSNGQPLPPSLQHRYESEFGADLSKVTLHESHVPTLMGAESYTRGSDIHFKPGGLNPYSEEGEKLLAHELAHVVQQKGNPTGNEEVKTASQSKSLMQEVEDTVKRIFDF